MPSPSQEPWYTLGEVSRAVGISEGKLDHACRQRRIPYRRDPNGYRLLSQATLEALKKKGLAAFPRPYDPVAIAAPEESTPKQADRPAAADRIGLLAEPSPEIVKAKERAEAAKLRVEEQQASLEQARISAERAALYKQMAAEREAEAKQRRQEQEAEAERWRQEAERQHRAEQTRQERRRRDDWFKHQVSLALSAASYELTVAVPYEQRSKAEGEIAAVLSEELELLTPDSEWAECKQGRQKAVERALAPYKVARTIEESLREIRPHLDRLYEDGYLSLRDEDREFLAKRLRPRVKAELERQARARVYRLREKEARQLVRDAIERELKLA